MLNNKNKTGNKILDIKSTLLALRSFESSSSSDFKKRTRGSSSRANKTKKKQVCIQTSKALISELPMMVELIIIPLGLKPKNLKNLKRNTDYRSYLVAINIYAKRLYND